VWTLTLAIYVHLLLGERSLNDKLLVNSCICACSGDVVGLAKDTRCVFHPQPRISGVMYAGSDLQVCSRGLLILQLQGRWW